MKYEIAQWRASCGVIGSRPAACHASFARALMIRRGKLRLVPLAEISASADRCQAAASVRFARLLRWDRGTITTSASSASAIATTVRSSGFAGAVSRRRTLAGFFPISRANSAFVMPFVVRNESSSFTIASIALISRLARSNSARNSGSFI
jgi:hypothetical protein